MISRIFLALIFGLLPLNVYAGSTAEEGPEETNAAAEAAILAGFTGDWIVKDQTGKKTCRVTFSLEATIGGFQIAADPACKTVFPVMDEVASWRLGDNAAIVFSDATRKMRIRFYTPDESYIADPEVDGIFTIEKAE